MSSINPFFTFNYSQPDDYRFSHDSVFLARRVFEHTQNLDLKNYSVLDLCAGCGIVGLDFLFHCASAQRELPQKLDFVEVQETYLEHFNMNAKNAPSPVEFFIMNYKNLFQSEKKYDLILCNPPFFTRDSGKLSPNTFKNRCRFFLDSTLIDLIKVIESRLKENGKAYVLSRIKINTTHLSRELDSIRGNRLTEIDGASTN